jgi:hypothetical protein
MNMIFGKILQLIGLIQVLLGLFYGIRGDMWRELYLLLGGLVVFIAGRMVEKKGGKRQ